MGAGGGRAAGVAVEGEAQTMGGGAHRINTAREGGMPAAGLLAGEAGRAFSWLAELMC